MAAAVGGQNDEAEDDGHGLSYLVFAHVPFQSAILVMLAEPDVGDVGHDVFTLLGYG